jgi:hypothetical protein
MGVMQRFQGKVAFDAPPNIQHTSGLTAHAGGGQTNALQLTGTMASVGTVGTAADSVKLPVAFPGTVYYLSNDAATNSMQVFGQGTNTINSVATATGVAQAAGVAALYFCTKAGNWNRVQSS